MYQIELIEFPVKMKIGVADFERKRSQKVFFSVTINMASSKFELENLETTIDYSKVANLIVQAFEGKEYMLLESVCFKCGELLIEEYSASDVTVAVEKSKFPGTIMRTSRVIVSKAFKGGA